MGAVKDPKPLASITLEKTRLVCHLGQRELSEEFSRLHARNHFGGGSEKLRAIWSSSDTSPEPPLMQVCHTDLGHAHVLVFVLDTATSERFSEAEEGLSRPCSGGHSGLLLCRFQRPNSTESYDDINTCRKAFDVA
ncbi:hypothetical protein K438DRAFT_1954053 [Mycena galopus ATCC 62051]|nr:hypothetical protein K438DRAFT_1954053 [Mycena galopus ATCC 62051]